MEADGKTLKQARKILEKNDNADKYDLMRELGVGETKARALYNQLKKTKKPRTRTFEEGLEREKGNYWERRYKELTREHAKALKLASVEDKLVESILAMVPRSYSSNGVRPPAGTSKSKKTPESYVLMFSDLHGGQTIDPDQTLGFGGYNFDIMAARVAYLENRVSSILKNHVTSPVDELVVVFLGDMLHGSLDHGGEAAQTQTLYSQWFTVGHILAQFLRNLSAQVKIRIHTVAGNHGRWPSQKKMPTENRYSNLDIFLYRYTQALTRDIENIAWNIDRQPFAVFDVQGFRFHASHGDHLRGGDKALGIPVHAAARQITSTTQLYVKNAKRPPDYYLVGDKHKSIQLPHGMGDILFNGGFPGVDNYSLQGNFVPVDPMQRLFGVHPRYGRTALYDVGLKHATVQIAKYYRLPSDR